MGARSERAKMAGTLAAVCLELNELKVRVTVLERENASMKARLRYVTNSTSTTTEQSFLDKLIAQVKDSLAREQARESVDKS